VAALDTAQQNLKKLTTEVDVLRTEIRTAQGDRDKHFDQVVKITQLGEEIVAVKITGDEHVPGGAVTFRANVRTGAGEGQVAEKEYRNACFVPGKLEIAGPDRIAFTWENCGRVEFRKDD
jgi:hypothetical protein